MISISVFLIFSAFNLALGQNRLQIEQQTTSTTPVPILRQVNQQNEDGSFTYGYENADGTYKIETRDASGQVKGKYGYYDNEGTLREIEYGANKHGFNPSGTGINIPPQVIPSSSHDIEDDDGSYRPPGPGQDGAYDRFKYENQQGDLEQQPRPQIVQLSQQQRPRKLRPRNQARLLQQQQQQQYYQPQQYEQQQYIPQVPQQQFQYQQPQYQQQQAQQQQQYTYQPINLAAGTFQGHPASNIDINSGSYSLNYSG